MGGAATSVGEPHDDEGTSYGEDTGDDPFNPGCNFFCPPDGGMATFECDVWGQDCPDGQKCSPWANDGGMSWNATKCTPIDLDAHAVGEPCTVEGSGVSGVDSCALGSMCWVVDPETLEGTCVAQCQGTEANPVCSDGTACFISNKGTLHLCLPTCAPLADPCDEGFTCRPVLTEDPHAFVCIPLGSQGVIDDGCETCGLGELCVSAQSQLGCETDSGCCSVYCDLEDPSADALCSGLVAGHTCIPYFDAPQPLGYVGICGIR